MSDSDLNTETKPQNEQPPSKSVERRLEAQKPKPQGVVGLPAGDTKGEVPVPWMDAPKVVGFPDAFVLLMSTETGRHKEATYAMEIPNAGCLVKTVMLEDGFAQWGTLVFVPGVTIENDVNGGKRLKANPMLELTAGVETIHTIPYAEARAPKPVRESLPVPKF
jgi:hypothetical protein